MLLRDENIDLRERIIDVETDYVTLNDSYKHFITVCMKLMEIVISCKEIVLSNLGGKPSEYYAEFYQ